MTSMTPKMALTTAIVDVAREADRLTQTEGCEGRLQFEACSVSVVKHGKIIFSHGSGKVGKSDCKADNTVFLIASLSKPFLAILSLQCQRKGELDLDRDINYYLEKGKFIDRKLRKDSPTSENNRNNIDDTKIEENALNAPDDNLKINNPHYPNTAVTCRQLLMHRSSLIDDESALLKGSKWRVEGKDFPKPLRYYVRKRFLDSDIWSSKSSPGKAPYSYSNAGMTLLGHVLECATGMNLPSLADSRVLKPLRMTKSTYFLNTSLGGSMCIPGGHDGSYFGAGQYGIAEYPAAGLRCTSVDIGRFLEAVTGDIKGKWEKALGLTGEDMKQMLPPGYVNGLAWWGKDATYGDKRGGVWTHGGFMPGVRSHMYFWPDKKVGAVFLSNGVGSYTNLEKNLKLAMESL
ncbi:hypothetical protein AAMO2058_000072200 [Amorphochlora amoebiformis]